MATNGFYKVGGATERQDQIVKIGNKNWLLIYGFGKDDDAAETGYNWRKNYDHEPTEAEVKADVDALVNAETDARILTGFVWNGIHVYLSTENQYNFKAAYDLAVQTSGSILPITMKLGTDAEGNVAYHTFEDVSDFTDFYTKAFAYINEALVAGWTEKDGASATALLNLDGDE